MKEKHKHPEDEQDQDLAQEPIAEEPPSQERPADALEEALTAEKNRYLRLAAEYDNYRKRSQKEREALYRDVKSSVASKFLPVYDNLERALSQETEDDAFSKGVEMTMTQLWDIFRDLGISKIPAVGEQFDPVLHNAVFHVEDENYGENEIIEQFMTGFMLGDKVIRHSVVKVAN